MIPIAYKLKRSEVACKCGCGFASMYWSLLLRWTLFRLFIGCSVSVLSGCRCPEHNEKVGGSPTSKHMICRALDLATPKGYTLDEFASICAIFFPTVITEYKGKKYEWGVHVDVREDGLSGQDNMKTIFSILKIWLTNLIGNKEYRYV